MGFKSGSAYGNEPGLTFFDRMDALESEVRKLKAKIDTVESEVRELKAEVEVKIDKEEFLEETRKLREEIEKSTDMVKNIRGEHKNIRERLYYVYERDIPKASGSKVISNEKAADNQGGKVISNEKAAHNQGGKVISIKEAADNQGREISIGNAAVHEGRAFMDAFHFSSETGGERQAEDND